MKEQRGNKTRPLLLRAAPIYHFITAPMSTHSIFFISTFRLFKVALASIFTARGGVGGGGVGGGGVGGPLRAGRFRLRGGAQENHPAVGMLWKHKDGSDVSRISWIQQEDRDAGAADLKKWGKRPPASAWGGWGGGWAQVQHRSQTQPRRKRRCKKERDERDVSAAEVRGQRLTGSTGTPGPNITPTAKKRKPRGKAANSRAAGSRTSPVCQQPARTHPGWPESAPPPPPSAP